MNTKLQRMLDKIKNYSKKIKGEAEYISELINEVEEPEDITQIEMAFDNIERWAKEAYDVCRHTYDEFEEEQQ